MANDSSRRRTVIIVVLVLLALLALLLSQCKRPATKEVVATSTTVPAPAAVTPAAPVASTPAPSAPEPAEVLTAATVQAPATVEAGAAFHASWTGPGNKGDYLTIVGKEAPASVYASYRETREGATLELTAPIEAGDYEVRYVASRSKTILGRAAIVVTPTAPTLTAPAEIILGAPLSVKWTGPNNRGDYITLVPIATPDGQYGNFAYTTKGSPLDVTAPVTIGNAELRYMSGQGDKVLARRAITIITPEVKLSGPTECIAGTTITVPWTGPNNSGDYITLVPKETKDGQYGNYTNTSAGPSLKILAPIMEGEAELRYMTGQGAKVLARSSVKIVAAKITLSADAEAKSGAPITITWTGPNNPGDYITVVPKTAKDGFYGQYANTTKSPLIVGAPKEPGDAEIRYMSGQGAKVLARRPIKIVGGN